MANAMHRLAMAVSAVLAAFVLVLAVPAAAQEPGRNPDYSEFYQALDPHGEWLEHARFGLVWVPYANEDRDWRPYARGQWVYTEEHGWYWESDEEWGWATYHYGRWYLDQQYGWIWVPGTEWAPAWVAWRQSDDYVGWAPLPPEATWDPYGNAVATFDAFHEPGYYPYWIFVRPSYLTSPRIYRYFFPPVRNSFFFNYTRPMTHYAYRDRRVFNRGVDRAFGAARDARPPRGRGSFRRERADPRWRLHERHDRGYAGVHEP